MKKLMFNNSFLIILILFLLLSCYMNDNNSEYQIGDQGPAGGFIFYKKAIKSDGWQFIEAAPYDLPKSTWGTFLYIVPGAEGLYPGTGKQNTLDIIAGDSEIDKAADRCYELVVDNGGVTYDDWYLPSWHELNKMFDNLKLEGIGNLSDDYYWSSTETNDQQARALHFLNGDQTSLFKTYPELVRAIRYF